VERLKTRTTGLFLICEQNKTARFAARRGAEPLSRQPRSSSGARLVMTAASKHPAPVPTAIHVARQAPERPLARFGHWEALAVRGRWGRASVLGVPSRRSWVAMTQA